MSWHDAVDVVSPALLSLAVLLLNRGVSSITKMVAQLDIHTTQLMLHDTRIKAIEDETRALRVVVDDLRGFLADAGFRKRDGKP